jgi:hypothetical protein
MKKQWRILSLSLASWEEEKLKTTLQGKIDGPLILQALVPVWWFVR